NRPLHYWSFLPEPVRPWFVRRIRIIGPESTGKTVLARKLAAQYQTVRVSEYARSWIDLHSNLCRAEDFERYVQGQIAAEDALARQANRLLICDTDPFTTQLWSRLLFGHCPAWIEVAARERHYALTLVTSPDTPWVDDGQRYQPDIAGRRAFFADCLAALDAAHQRYVVLQGNWEQRFHDACAAVNRVLAEGGCLPDESES
ncbi:MAG TPA: AAA family ATPase, partial [Candidatus Ozemobacteraceae bacterium]|nr:AAA family ATPase [Candidatus Ozemobacteraceae bacterium]